MKKNYSTLTARVLASISLLLLNFTLSYGQSMDINQTISDGAQSHQIAFDGLGFLSGDFCSSTFLPPGKVADYFGFQYMRDNDITFMGHNSDFGAVVANNLLYVLTPTQKTQLVNLAISQVPKILQYGSARFPLIDAFVRMRDNNMPLGSTGLDSMAVKAYSAQLYRLDGRISIERAQLYANIINAFTPQQTNYLDSIFALGMANMPSLQTLPLVINPQALGLNNSQFVAVMSYADDIFSWYVGNIPSDVYFCPERQGNYFGSFYLKDAPAMGNPNYSIDTNLSQHGGQRFLDALDSIQKPQITDLLNMQRYDLYTLVNRRTDISTLLRGYLSGTTVDTNIVLSLSETYGELDGMISYNYATNFSHVGWTLTQAQRDTLNTIRNLDNYPCSGAYLYSDSIQMPNIMNTDFLFLTATGINESLTNNYNINAYPNPFNENIQINFTLAEIENVKMQITDVLGRVVKEFPNGMFKLGTQSLTWDGTDNSGNKLKAGMYNCRIISSTRTQSLNLILLR